MFCYSLLAPQAYIYFSYEAAHKEENSTLRSQKGRDCSTGKYNSKRYLCKQEKIFIIYLFHSVADLGGAVGGNCPLHNENSPWRPIFRKEGAPCPDPSALYFSCFVLNVGNISIKALFNRKTREFFLKKGPKFLRAWACFLSLFLAPTLQIGLDPPSTLGWIRP